ncbi:MAG: hypothetical protein ACR2NZ_13880 [Rubripirellula sp.]
MTCKSVPARWESNHQFGEAVSVQRTGCNAKDGLEVDVIADSMGAIVARAMVELEGGDQLVDRCLLTGPPNQGTVLAEGVRMAMWASTLIVGGTLLAPLPARLLSGLLNRSAKDAVGPNDLRPKSEILQKLNAGNDRPLVPYHMLAGAFQLPTDADNNLLQKVAGVFWKGYAGALSWLTDDRHDLVIGMRSMATVRGGGDFNGKVTTQVVRCNHFNYLTASQSQLHVKAWLEK